MFQVCDSPVLALYVVVVEPRATPCGPAVSPAVRLTELPPAPVNDALEPRERWPV